MRVGEKKETRHARSVRLFGNSIRDEGRTKHEPNGTHRSRDIRGHNRQNSMKRVHFPGHSSDLLRKSSHVLLPYTITIPAHLTLPQSLHPHGLDSINPALDLHFKLNQTPGATLTFTRPCHEPYSTRTPGYLHPIQNPKKSTTSRYLALGMCVRRPRQIHLANTAASQIEPT